MPPVFSQTAFALISAFSRKVVPFSSISPSNPASRIVTISRFKSFKISRISFSFPAFPVANIIFSLTFPRSFILKQHGFSYPDIPNHRSSKTASAIPSHPYQQSILGIHIPRIRFQTHIAVLLRLHALPGGTAVTDIAFTVA